MLLSDTSLCPMDKPVCRKCRTCGHAACWSPLSFPSTLACLEQIPHCRHMADMPVARCCGSDGIRRCRTGLHGGRCHVVSAILAAPMSGWRLRPHCEELKGHLEEDDWRLRDWQRKYMFPVTSSGQHCNWPHFHTVGAVFFKSNHAYPPECNQASLSTCCFFYQAVPTKGLQMDTC